MGALFGLQPMQQRSSLHQSKFILQPRWLKPPHCPSQAQQSHREKPGPLFTAGKAKGLLLSWEIIQLTWTLALKAHFPSLPLFLL